MNHEITVYGKIIFEPEDKTRKHTAQSSWKRMAMLHIDHGDLADYYAWFVLKRYNLPLNKPLRGSHISFINDSLRDFSVNNTRNIEEIDTIWEAVKLKWDKKKVAVILDISPKTDDKHWWLRVTDEGRKTLQDIRTELGLGKPFWGMHMTIGHANEKFEYHSEYIHGLIKKGLITT